MPKKCVIPCTIATRERKGFHVGRETPLRKSGRGRSPARLIRVKRLSKCQAAGAR
jgi:hypothetical protein